MNLINLRSQRVAPYLIFIFIVTIFFTVISVSAYQIEFDPVPQMKGIQQWLRGESTLLNSLVTVNPKDISQNLQTWIVWHAPGVSIAYLPLTAIGLPLGVAARTTAYILFVSGGIGWLKLLDAIGSDWRVKMIVSCLLSLYYLEIGCSFIFTAGDVIPWAVLPWLLVYTIYICSQLDLGSKSYNHMLLHSALLGLLLGGVYWLKYSGFLVSVGVLTYIIINLLFFNKSHSLLKRLMILAICTVSTLLPVICLTLIHQSLAGVNSAVDQFQNAIPVPSPDTRGWRLLVSFLAAPGLALFNSEIFAANRLLMYTSIIVKNLFGLDISEKKDTLKTLVGLGGTLVVAWFFMYSAKNICDKKALTFWCCITLIPFVFIAYISNKAGVNLLIFGIGRYGSSFFILTVFYIITSYLHLISNLEESKVSKVVASLVLIFFLLMPPLSSIADAVEAMSLRKDYVTAENFLYVNLLSKKNVKSVVAKVNSAVKSPQDVVVLAKDSRDYRFSSWLEIKSRFLPLDGVEEDGNNSKITSSQDLRVILVVSKIIDQDEKMMMRIKQRFVQATGWSRLSEDVDAEVSIWFSDLKA
jgi:hypothetical protein